MSNAASAALATQWKDLWNGDLGAADKIIAEDFLAHAAPLTGTGPDELRAEPSRDRSHDLHRRHREGARARLRWRPPGGHRHRPRWQRPRAAARPMSAAPRSRAQRRRDTEHRLTHDKEVWVASASADGAPYLVPLSVDWDGEALLMATPTDGPTGRNLAATRAVRLGLGHTRDVSMIEGEVEVPEIDALPQEARS